VDAGRLGSDEQLLADLPVGPALGDQCEHLNLSPCQAKRGGRGWRGLGGRGWRGLGRGSGVHRLFEAKSARAGRAARSRAVAAEPQARSSSGGLSGAPPQPAGGVCHRPRAPRSPGNGCRPSERGAPAAPTRRPPRATTRVGPSLESGLLGSASCRWAVTRVAGLRRRRGGEPVQLSKSCWLSAAATLVNRMTVSVLWSRGDRQGVVDEHPACPVASSVVHSGTPLSWMFQLPTALFSRAVACTRRLGPSAGRLLAMGWMFVVAVGLRVGLPPGRHQPALGGHPPMVRVLGCWRTQHATVARPSLRNPARRSCRSCVPLTGAPDAALAVLILDSGPRPD
jgi:hypothetical protein